MKKFLTVLVSLAAAVLISAFLAPALYPLLPFKFEKILNRLLIISFFIVCFTSVRINRAFFEECGLRLDKKVSFTYWLTGFLTSFSILFFLILLEYKIGVLQFSEPFSLGALLVLTSLFTGVTVGLVEEFFFRGFLFLNFKRLSNMGVSVVITSVIYSFVHFLKSGKPLVDTAPDMTDSFRVILSSLQVFSSWGTIWPAFIGLFLFGIVLNLVFIRTKSLFWVMGIHAGAVFLLKLISPFYTVNPQYSTLIFGERGFYSGILGWVFTCLIGLSVYYLSSLALFRKSR